MHAMTDPEVRGFLQHATRTAKLATVCTDGRPHVVPVWFVLDGEDIMITTMSASLKARNLQARPQVSLCVDDELPPYAFVTVHGIATVEHRPSDLLEWTTRVARRYLGDAAAVEAGQRYADLDDLLVRVRPTTVIGYANVAG
jgi:PPOX class probable F420-dependent enzyme